jgi:hypothetical protein
LITRLEKAWLGLKANMTSARLSALFTVAGTIILALALASSSTATVLSVEGITKNESVAFTATLASGTSLLFKAEDGTTTDTCTTSEIKGKTEGTFTGASVGGKISTLTFKNCTHTTTVLANGSLSFAWTSGTNGTVSLSSAEVTVQSTSFGTSAVCKTGSGTNLGTFTGVTSGLAKIDVNASVSCGILGNATWTGTYSVTSPAGLGVEEKEIEAGTELFQDTGSGIYDKLGTGTEITASLKTGTSALLKDEFGTTTDTCSASEAKGKIESPGGDTSYPSGKLSSLTFSSCTHTTTVLAPGELEVRGTAGSTNGTVYSKNAELTVQSTFFGASAICKTGAGTKLGTLTAAEAGKLATIDISAKVDCGILGNASWTGTYTTTSPTGLVVEKTPISGTELYRNTGSGVYDTLGTGTEITASLKTGTSALLKDEFGTTTDTCSASEAKGKIESPGGEISHPSGKLSSLTFSSCTHTTTVIAPGELEVRSTAGSTNGTVYSKSAEITVYSTFFTASAVCKTGTGTAIGTLTAAGPGGQATIDINAKVNCGILGTASWTGTYTVTSPTGLVVEKT